MKNSEYWAKVHRLLEFLEWNPETLEKLKMPDDGSTLPEILELAGFTPDEQEQLVSDLNAILAVEIDSASVWKP